MNATQNEIILNGERRKIDSGATISDVLALLDIEPENAKGIAVAVGDEVISQQNWSTREIHAGDRVEVIGATQGG